MPIQIQCSSCGSLLRAPDTSQGKSLPCPKCKQPIVVPRANQGSPQPTANQNYGAPNQGAPGGMPQQQMGYGQPQMGAPMGYGGQMAPPGQTGYGQPMQGGYGYGMQPKKSNSKLLIGLGAGAVLLIVAVVGIVLMLPSGDDLQANNADNNAVTQTPATDTPAETSEQPEDNTNTEGSADAANDADTGEPEETTEVSFELEVDPNDFIHSGATTASRTQVSAVVSDDGVVQIPMRTWIKKDGTEIIGMLKRRPEGETEIELLTEDGETVSLKREDLDEIDNDYLRKLIASLPEAQDPEGSSKPTPIAAAGALGNSFLNMPKSASYVPDAITPLKISEHVLLGMPERAFAPSLEHVVLSSDRSIAMVVMNGRVTGREQAWLELIDLRKNKFVGFFPFPALEAMPFGITADNLGIFSFTSQGIDVVPQLDSWRLEKDEIVLQNSVVLGKSSHDEAFGSDPFGSDPLDAGSLGTNTLGSSGLTGRGKVPLKWFFTKFGVINDKTCYLYNNREISFMDIETGKILYSDGVWFLDRPAFSANRKYMAFQPHDPFSARRGGDQILIIDCEKLELAATFDAPKIRSLAFSEDGTKLAINPQYSGQHFIKVLDIASGEWIQEMEIPAQPDSIYWSGNEYVVVTGGGFHAVLDVFNSYPVARWSSRDFFGMRSTFPVPLGNNTFVRCLKDFGQQPNILHTMQLPQPEWIDPSLNSNMFYIQLKDNDVSIDLGGTDFDTSEKARVRAGIEERIRDAGGRVADNARLRVECTTKPGGQRSMTFVRRGFGRQGKQEYQTVTYKVYLNEINLYEDDELLKTFRRYSGGIGVSYGTIAEIRASAEANYAPDPNFFINTDLSLKMIRTKAWEDIPTY